ncbi:MAG: FAD-binding and (Fe-S)-binding domain-containing protein [Flavobacteriaceae bacterium]
MDKIILEQLGRQLKGELFSDRLSKSIYATDASVYRRIPLAVAYPRNEDDIKLLIDFATKNKIGLIPRTAGTSLAGQCVGDGIVVDVSKHFTSILELDVGQKSVKVQPGVIRDELNLYLKPHGLFFGPNTSTSNRCMMGGMVGNNSSGTTSIQYGVTRDKVLALKTILSDGSTAIFEGISKETFEKKEQGDSLESRIYKSIFTELSDKKIREQIIVEFPKKNIHRRNTAYAVDALLDSGVFVPNGPDLNISKLLCGSEGTLAFTTEITLRLDDLPPKETAMVVTHYKTLEDCLSDVVPLMNHQLHLCEMMDKVILDCTKNNRAQFPNRFFVSGDPAALLMLQLRDETEQGLENQLEELLSTVNGSGRSYAHPVLRNSDIPKAIELRKAGLGLLGNLVGDRKAVACIEDTAVALDDLKEFITEFTGIMEGYGQQAVYYAHAGAGELHLRPILNLKKSEDVGMFRSITTDVARLTKRYGGSFSGEHGDGIVRSEFIPMMLGEANYELFKRIKGYFDPQGIFNPGKIVDPYPMDQSLRYELDQDEIEIETLLDFSDSEGILKAAEKCNGSGDCRKTHLAKGAMCPSYHATREEKDTTRARANLLREVLTNADNPNKFDSEELREVFDLCLSCKACSSECPSNVDVASLKAEFLYQYQEVNGYALKNKLVAYNISLNRLASKWPWLFNAVFSSFIFGPLIKKFSGISLQRRFPKISSFNSDKYLKLAQNKSVMSKQKLVLLIDEFSRYWDTTLVKDAIDLLCGLGYEVALKQVESGRVFISKGFLKQAKQLAVKNINELYPIAREGTPIIGLEPSAILTFRDEYKRFHLDTKKVEDLANQTYLIEEFLAKEIARGSLTADLFTKNPKMIKIHSHCHQKALSNQKVTFDILNLPQNYKVSIINSGCCGMAGSFGYEKEHYDVSMKVGELSLFPAVRQAGNEVIIAANGTSCRHQIFDGTGRIAHHPVTVLNEALIVN